ncbi:dNTP triphosphohydrolase [bacterium]|nr:dNTP triphosphohydrolase [bacterium]NCQ55405.1 dNTP triphosphohydrolase [Candidatus Parcubacteria bacterium]NCS67767.1 dNTP triphosphohydrolase [Candidatus Peregrinibacteria bacterium]NCS96419.1 dNTP triphosphohydrolase [bacterium]
MKNNTDGAHLWQRFDSVLAPFAQHNESSRGRKFPERVDPDRLPYQRDRDRIIHTTAFRRLKGKMQVVSPTAGDHFRNRLSHTLEVSQVARDLARHLKLNEDLAEAVALAHDLGHPPFGHAGEKALDRKMREHGFHFDHNVQSLRVVEVYERRYDDFAGLNLTLEVLEGIQKHERTFDRGQRGKIFFPHLESQLVDISDEIAYLAADLEDGMRAGFFGLDDLRQFPICAEALAEIEGKGKILRATFIRKMIHKLLYRLVNDTQENLEFLNIQTLAQVQKMPRSIVAFSPEFYADFLDLKQFLMQHFYRQPSVKAMTEHGEHLIENVFDYLLQHPDKIPAEFMPEENLHQRICDYIAGMTDRFLENFSR